MRKYMLSVRSFAPNPVINETKGNEIDSPMVRIAPEVIMKNIDFSTDNRRIIAVITINNGISINTWAPILRGSPLTNIEVVANITPNQKSLYIFFLMGYP